MVHLEGIELEGIEVKSMHVKSMRVASVERDIHSVIAELLSVDAALITSNSCLRNDLGADSLDLAELINTLSGKYEHTAIYDVKVQEIKTVGEIVTYINKNQQVGKNR